MDASDEEQRAALWAKNQRLMLEAKQSRELGLAGDTAACNRVMQAWEPVLERGYTVEGVVLDGFDDWFPTQGN